MIWALFVFLKYTSDFRSTRSDLEMAIVVLKILIYYKEHNLLSICFKFEDTAFFSICLAAINSRIFVPYHNHRWKMGPSLHSRDKRIIKTADWKGRTNSKDGLNHSMGEFSLKNKKLSTASIKQPYCNVWAKTSGKKRRI